MSDHLPLDAWTEILTRLPLKNILQCTIVSKSWYTLITSANFIDTHLNRSIAKRDTRLLIRESVEKASKDQTGKEHYSVHWDNESFDEDAKFSFPYSSVLGGMLRVVGNCNGLVCLSDDRYGFVRTMYLWNPSIRKFITLPRPHFSYMLHGSYTNSYGFGINTDTNDYKIVRMVHLEEGGYINVPPEVELYELSTGSWRRISAGKFNYVVRESSPHAFLNGVVHWFGYDWNKYKSGDLLIVTFGMRNEALGVMKVPLGVEMDWEMRLGVYRESLSLIHKPRNDGSCNVWVMKEYGVAKSWTKQFTIDVNRVDLWRPSYFRENGDILLVNSDRYMYLGYGFGGDLLSYDPKSEQINTVDGKRDVSYVGTYLESLVLIKCSGRHQNFSAAVTSEGALPLPIEKDEDKVNQ